MNRILRRILIGLAMLTGIPVFFIMALFVWFMSYTYWTADTKFDRGGAGEFLATFVALNPEAAKTISLFSLKHCDDGHPSLSDHNCARLSMINRGVCRWWFGERCEAYKTTDLFLRNSDKFGVLLHAAIDPCSYLDEMKGAGGQGSWCERKYEKNEQRRPVVILFKDNDREKVVQIRIDFSEGFTTAAEKQIRQNKDVTGEK